MMRRAILRMALLFAGASLASGADDAAPATPAASPAPEIHVEDFTPANAAHAEEVLKIAKSAIRAFASNNLIEARKQFRHLLEIDPGNITGLVNLGTIEYRLGHFDAAIENLDKALRIEPRAAPAWLTLGVIRVEKGEFDAALAALSQAVLLDPKNSRAHGYLGVAIGSKGWYLGAEQELRRAIELDPEYAEAHFNLALFYLRRNPPAIELARRHYERARELGAAPDPLVEKQLAK